MSIARFYPIDTPGEPWTDLDRAAWRRRLAVQRSYKQEVLDSLQDLPEGLVVDSYGSLSADPERYPLMRVIGRSSNPDAPWVLITGGVHGYETSGVQGALAFLHTHAASYAERVNLVVVPCVSPWGYEVINRWNPQAMDPNRSFVEEPPTEESTALQHMVRQLNARFLLHLDLHETTDSDEQEFRPALAARDGLNYTPGLIPDGFYTVGDSDNPQPALQGAIISAVKRVTHIAPADANQQIIGSDVTQPGVINYPFKALGLCAGMTGARFTSTTEVYPDSPRATPEICNHAQLAAIRGALEHCLA
ncbi:MAG: hypothetical protein ACI9MC_001360 [Kiritimatiellia bacterium]|jgi:hypothetical protein